MKRLIAMTAAAFLVAGCSDADVASKNLSKAADQFEVNRRIVFYNGITGEYMLTIEGLCSLGNHDKPRELSVTCKTGAAAFKKHFLGLSDNVTFRNWPRAGDFALRNRLPTVCEFSQLVDGGCLISYGPTFAEFTERVAQQVDRILRGAKPTELPFEQPTRFELVVNMKTARAIGVAIPQAVLLQATRVIE